MSEKGKECQALRHLQYTDPAAFNRNFRKVWSPTDPYFFKSKDFDPERHEALDTVRPDSVKLNRTLTRFDKDGNKLEFYIGYTKDGYKTYVPKIDWDTYIDKNNNAPSNGIQAKRGE